ncbi:hypothetical protein [Streptomyces sp. NPDC059783]|uniref:hypothetical protein n=1 Tax=Streptomyces sp. NPDC059783 TaxID=3346944 RepID=UPI0036586D4C
MNDLATARTHEYERVLSDIIANAERLDILRRLETGGVDPHASSALYALRYAATILWPIVPSAPPPGYRHDNEHLLWLIGNWRDAALGLGEFAPDHPDLQIVTDTTPPS